MKRKVLRDCLQFEKDLRHLTHKILAAQENERRTISRQLQDEIAQGLISIDVGLLNLKTAAHGNTAHLRKEIASAQRLVEDAIQAIHRFAHELDTQ